MSSLSGVWTSAWQIWKLFSQFPQSVYVLYMLELAGSVVGDIVLETLTLHPFPGAVVNVIIGGGIQLVGPVD